MATVTPPKQAPPPTPRTDFGEKVKAHQRYRTSDGTYVPGVTTVLQVLAKPALIKWANRLGLEGLDSDKFTSEAAAVGSLAHYWIEVDLKKQRPDPALSRDYSDNQQEHARWGYAAFRAWRSHLSEFNPVLVEHPLVSDTYGYGGTIDCVAMIDGKLTLLDLKTSSGVWPEHIYQVGAYWKLLDEARHKIKGARILRIGRSPDEGMDEHVLSGAQLLRGWRVFHHCLEIWRLKKEEKG